MSIAPDGGMQHNISTLERVVSIAAGAGLIASRWGKPASRWAVGTGAGLIARGAAGYCPVSAAIGRDTTRDDTRRALGGSRGLHVRRGITIRQPPELMYRFWRNLENLPTFMSHLLDVEMLDDQHSHWVVRGPAGKRLEWDAEIINDVEARLIAWRSLPGADVVSAGSVHFFENMEGGTDLLVHLQYNPPGGKAGGLMAMMLGEDPAAQIDEDLRRLKQALETEMPPRRGLTPAASWP